MPKEKGSISQFLSEKNINGFTLVEMLVVMAIIGIISVVTLANYRQEEKKLSLSRSAQRLAQDFRSAEEMAMAGEKFYGQFPLGGYGIYLIKDSNSYILFADCDADGKYGAGNLTCSDCTGGPCVPNVYTEKIKDLTLEDGVLISDLAPISVFSDLNIVILPPDPKITITPLSPDNYATTTLTFNGGTKQVIINTAGLIDVR